MSIYNDIEISNKNDLSELKDDINDIIQKEFLNPTGLYVEASFLRAVEKQGEIKVEYNAYRPDDLHGLNTPKENMLGIQVLRDPDDIVRAYYRDVLLTDDSFDLVTESDWEKELTKIENIVKNMFSNTESIKQQLMAEAVDKYHQENRIMYWELDEKLKDSIYIIPSEFKDCILKTEEAVRWKISEYLKDNPEASASYSGPYDTDDEKMFEGINHKHWQEKYKNHCAYATLLESKNDTKNTLNFKP